MTQTPSQKPVAPAHPGGSGGKGGMGETERHPIDSSTRPLASLGMTLSSSNCPFNLTEVLQSVIPTKRAQLPHHVRPSEQSSPHHVIPTERAKQPPPCHSDRASRERVEESMGWPLENRCLQPRHRLVLSEQSSSSTGGWLGGTGHWPLATGYWVGGWAGIPNS